MELNVIAVIRSSVTCFICIFKISRDNDDLKRKQRPFFCDNVSKYNSYLKIKLQILM